MSTPHKLPIVFTGIEGSIVLADSEFTTELSSAIELLKSRHIPLILTSDKIAAANEKILNSIFCLYPYIVECGAAIHIPRDELQIDYSHQRQQGDFNIIEFGIDRKELQGRISSMCESLNIEIRFLSDFHYEEVVDRGLRISPTEFEEHGRRFYSEATIFDGDSDTRRMLDEKAEDFGLRIKDRDDLIIFTGDHDEGTAVRFLVQLYREEYSENEIETIGLGSSWMDAPMLHAVDYPILIRRSNGRFDERVGRRGLRFTNDPGPTGWNAAILALLSDRENEEIKD